MHIYHDHLTQTSNMKKLVFEKQKSPLHVWVIAYDTITRGWDTTYNGKGEICLYTREEAEDVQQHDSDNHAIVHWTQYIHGREIIYTPESGIKSFKENVKRPDEIDYIKKHLTHEDFKLLPFKDQVLGFIVGQKPEMPSSENETEWVKTEEEQPPVKQFFVAVDSHGTPSVKWLHEDEKVHEDVHPLWTKLPKLPSLNGND